MKFRCWLEKEKNLTLCKNHHICWTEVSVLKYIKRKLVSIVVCCLIPALVLKEVHLQQITIKYLIYIRGAGLDDILRSPPAPNILCDSNILCDLDVNLPSQMYLSTFACDSPYSQCRKLGFSKDSPEQLGKLLTGVIHFTSEGKQWTVLGTSVMNSYSSIRILLPYFSVQCIHMDISWAQMTLTSVKKNNKSQPKIHWAPPWNIPQQN